MKRGFTLIELMGVILILSLLVMISVPIVDKYVKKAKSDTMTSQQEFLILAAKNWAADNNEELPKNGSFKLITFDTLMELGYLPLDMSLENLKVDASAVKITNTNNKYTYSLEQSETSDKTGPINLELKLVNATVNSLTVKAIAEDPESPIKTYEFNIDGNQDYGGGLKWVGATGARAYTFKNISEGKHYIIFRAINSKGLKTESRKFYFDTNEISKIDFIVKGEYSDCDSARTIRVIFPADSTNTAYKLGNNSSFTSVTSPYIDITQPNITSITARATVEGADIMVTYNIKYIQTHADGSQTVCP